MDNDLLREIQELYEDGQYLQIVQRLRQFKFDKLPAGINISIVVEAIIRSFESSNQDEIGQATGLMIQLEHAEFLNRNDLDKIFNAVSESFLNAQGKTLSLLVDPLMFSRDKSAPEALLKLYSRATTQVAKVVLADNIGAFYKEQGLLVLVDNLYSQQLIGNDNIHAIFKKHSLVADVSLEPDECDSIISGLLEFLEVPGPEINSSDAEEKFKIDIINRVSAARILVVLSGYPNTSEESRAKIQGKSNLIVTSHCVDRMSDAFEDIRLSRYLSGNIR